MIPKVQGKIVFQKKGDTSYVMYETGRPYDPNRQYTIPQRKVIGVRLPDRPELMLPNENYLTYFPKGEEDMTENEKEAVQAYATEREHGLMLRDFFDQLFYEFQAMSRKNPETVVNENKVKRLNRVLEPLMKMLKDEEEAQFLELIPEPETQKGEDGQTVTTGMSYGDVILLLTQFKSAVNRFFQKRR